MSRVYTLTEFELRAIVKSVVQNSSNKAAPSYALLLADEVEGKNLTPDEIVNLFEEDDDLFPPDINSLEIMLVKAGH